jgi:hypothetical protein
LRIAQGQVRCGRCNAQFNALDSLADDPETLEDRPTDTLDSAAASAPEEDARADQSDEPAFEQLTPEQHPAPDAEPGAALPEVAPPPAAPELVVDAAVSQDNRPEADVLTPEIIQAALLIEEPERRSSVSRLTGWLAIAALLLLLAGQWVYLQRAPLFEREALRPVLRQFCAVLGCALPLPRQPERIEIIERVVREQAQVAQALFVELTFVSRADQTIAYPVLELRLSDVSGNRAASRRFLPADYLPAQTDIRAGLSPGLPVHVTLELVAPEFEVVSFYFDFF